MTDLTQVVCPTCSGVNRVPTARLGDGPKCGSCHAALFAGHPAELTERSFDAQVGRGDLPVVVDFWAAWCGPCRTMAPHFERAAAELEPRVRFGKVDTDREQRLAGRFAIRGIPTVIVFRGGREIARQSGAMDLPRLRAWLGSVLG